MGRNKELGKALYALAKRQAEWSNKTFGDESVRGPSGPLEHLAKEAIEAKEAYALQAEDDNNLPSWEKYKSELADCLILILDAARRSGMSLTRLVACADEKMGVNEKRQHPKLEDQDPDKAVEHVRDLPAGHPENPFGVAVNVITEEFPKPFNFDPRRPMFDPDTVHRIRKAVEWVEKMKPVLQTLTAWNNSEGNSLDTPVKSS